MLLHAEVFGPIINTEFNSKKLLVILCFISTMHSVSFANWYVSSDRQATKKYRAEYHQHNSKSYLIISPKGNM